MHGRSCWRSFVSCSCRFFCLVSSLWRYVLIWVYWMCLFKIHTFQRKIECSLSNSHLLSIKRWPIVYIAKCNRGWPFPLSSNYRIQNSRRLHKIKVVLYIHEVENQYICSLHLHISAFSFNYDIGVSIWKFRWNCYQFRKVRYDALGGQLDLLNSSACISAFYNSRCASKTSYPTCLCW